MNHFENYLQFFLYPLNPFQFLFEKYPRHRSIHPTLLSNTKNSSSSLLSLDTPLSKASTDIPFPSRKTLFSLPKHVPRESFDHSSFRYEQPRGRDASSLRTKVHTHTHIRLHKIFRLSSRPSSSMSSRKGGSYSVVSLSSSPRGLAEK